MIGGTTSALLRMMAELLQRQPFRDAPGGFQCDLLIVDEASMMVLPHFLSLAMITRPDGEIMLAGDNRQLAPIVAHDWDMEDRPPAQHYQPFKSAYKAVLRIIAETPGLATEAARESTLTFTFRLPPIIRELISRVYDLDAIELRGEDDQPPAAPPQAAAGDGWGRVWQEETGLLLIVHSERGSRQSNALEADVIECILPRATAGTHPTR